MKREHPAPARNGDHTDLQEHYGEIGISAVAAAVRYKSDARNPAYAPVAPGSDAHAKIREGLAHRCFGGSDVLAAVDVNLGAVHVR
jgi:hypothetical protein